MANHKSALKRARQNEDHQNRNKSVKSRVRSAVRTICDITAAPSDQDMEIRLKMAQSIVDKAASKGCIHRNTAARRVSRLARMVNAAEK